ncbi:hypothetical protein PtA15_12A82 [Puccinia triticina]|uniref:Uncharacterized protein n=1 Tax=Puccinia triticina TaxID=208348 RepID=A0ABY7D082_9BASI|nr:uncharacterized protein PtA15_12A82 [Puccinia triticina]WAQ90097.1 hypothetical protein PtA15_12A82 [Puccinia triticina]WAR61384.1 hypothetical protein PtB15_12B69 [Puccinia triticina]
MGETQPIQFPIREAVTTGPPGTVRAGGGRATAPFEQRRGSAARWIRVSWTFGERTTASPLGP